MDRASGRRVIFGAPDAPRATVAEAVLASCAVPWIFAPVEIGGREYVDGGVWSPTNLDAVPAGRGSRVLCLIPTAGATLAPLRTASAAAAGYESMALRARGADVRTIVPDEREPRGDRPEPDGPEPARRGRRRRLRAGPPAGVALSSRAAAADAQLGGVTDASSFRALLAARAVLAVASRAQAERPGHPHVGLRRRRRRQPVLAHGAVQDLRRRDLARPRPAARSTRSTPAASAR